MVHLLFVFRAATACRFVRIIPFCQHSPVFHVFQADVFLKQVKYSKYTKNHDKLETTIKTIQIILTSLNFRPKPSESDGDFSDSSFGAIITVASTSWSTSNDIFVSSAEDGWDSHGVSCLAFLLGCGGELALALIFSDFLLAGIGTCALIGGGGGREGGGGGGGVGDLDLGRLPRECDERDLDLCSISERSLPDPEESLELNCLLSLSRRTLGCF